jgi:hypothetical protein
MVHRTGESAEAVIGHPAVGDASLAAFDPGDPFDSQCERLRREVTQLAIDCEKVTLYREMDPQRQLECLIAGILTGLIGAAFASTKREGRDYLMKYIGELLPVARLFAESMVDKNGKPIA